MTIPEIRDRLIELADAHGIAELRELASGLHRRRARRKAPVRSRPITAALAASIRAAAAADPKAAQHAIATRFGVNQGRVSEALSGRG